MSDLVTRDQRHRQHEPGVGNYTRTMTCVICDLQEKLEAAARETELFRKWHEDTLAAGTRWAARAEAAEARAEALETHLRKDHACDSQRRGTHAVLSRTQNPDKAGPSCGHGAHQRDCQVCAEFWSADPDSAQQTVCVKDGSRCVRTDHNHDSERIAELTDERDRLAWALRGALITDKHNDVLDAMMSWPRGANGPIAVAAYESLVQRLAQKVRPILTEIIAKLDAQNRTSDDR